MATLAFLYEHPQWFAPIFAKFERRGVPFQKRFAPDRFLFGGRFVASTVKVLLIA
jgi:hypothetical protein